MKSCNTDLYTALKFIDSLDNDNRMVYLRKEDSPLCGIYKYKPDSILTVKQVKEKYDMRKTKVIRIDPYFCCHEYEGLVLTVTKQEEHNGKDKSFGKSEKL